MARLLHLLLAALALLALAAPVALADDDDSPDVNTRAATGFTETSAVLHAEIEPNDDDWTGYRFQFGPGNYAHQTAVSWLWGDDTEDVSVQVTGLTQGSNYQFRAVAWNDDGATYGPRVKFSTVAAPGATSGDSADSGSTPEPTLGKTVVAEVGAGTVLVREQGSSDFYPLDAATAIPVNSVLDTTAGTVALETARAGGESQTGTFRGGLFQVRQSQAGKGMTEIALRGGDFSACQNGSAARAAVGSPGKKTLRRLWAKDKGGRFKTSGKGSVATVRGTSWYTADRCDGTLTRVSHGAVLVRERGTGRSKLVRHGQSFLAKLPH